LLVRAPDYSATQGGLRLLRELRFSREARLRDMLIIGVSGYRPMGQADLAKDLMTEFGISTFLHKPFSAEALVQTVCDALTK
ncbi:MAG: hypothetical protein AAFU65_14625, partial [Pseudomonadota bacterium]